MYGVLATLVVAAHFGYILFVVLGGMLMLRWRRAAWIHLPAVVWGAYIELSGGICPLTPLENRLRRLAGGATYTGGFIDRYLTRVIYPEGLTREAQIVLGLGVVLVNVAIYAWVRGRRRARREPSFPASS